MGDFPWMKAPYPPMSPNLPLNDDLTSEILYRLPARHVLRLRCVCKRWLSLTSDPRFIRSHSCNRNRNRNPCVSGCFMSDHVYHTEHFPLDGRPRGLPDPALAFIPGSGEVGPVSISSSCNGLIICCRASRPSLHKSLYYVCNPTTMEFVELPIPDGIDRYFSLAFDPSKSPHYRVVSIGSQLHVYSSETRVWTCSIDRESLSKFGGLHPFGGLHLFRTVFWNGALIWLGRESLLSFDVERECMKKLPMPLDTEATRCLYVGESKGCLYMIRYSKQAETTTQFDVFEMGSDCFTWSVLYHVDLTPIKDMYPEIHKKVTRRRGSGSNLVIIREQLAFKLVFFSRQGLDGDDLIVFSVPGKIISYNLQDKMFTKVCDVWTPPPNSYYCEYHWYKFYPYSHTLFNFLISRRI